MKILQTLIISALIGTTMSILIQFPFASSDSGSLTGFDAHSPDLSNMSLVLYDKFEQVSHNSTKDLHLEFFDEKNKTLIKNVSFFVNATKNDTVLLHELFFTRTGSMTLQFSPGNNTGRWIINGTAEPTLGGMMSNNDLLPIEMSAFTPGTYHFHIEVLALVYVNGIVDQAHPPKFDSWWSIDDKGNISKYENSTTVSIGTLPAKIKNASPLKQFRTGTASKDITCRQDLLLIFKSSNEAPICVKPDNAKKLESRGWAISQYHDPGAKSKIKLYDYYYDGIDKDNGIVSINNQTFYQTTLGYSAYDIPKKASTSFHDVVFAFPQGTLNTPGASFVMLDMKFHDGFEEIYGGTALYQNGTATKFGGIPIPTQYGPSVATNSITILGNHTMPQTGITIYHDKIKLLVSVDQLSTEDNSIVNSTAQVVPQCLTHILDQTIFSGYAGLVLCPVMDYHVSSKITNYTGFYGKYDVLNSSSVIGPDTYVGTGQEEMDKAGNNMMDGNFVLEPGHNATITYNITLSTMKCTGGCPDHFNSPTMVNLTNDVIFIHKEKNEMLYSHGGLEVKYDPQNVSLTDGQTTTLKATIMASKDVPRGTYWVILAPGNCAGGLLILLTVSDCEK